MQMGSNDVSSCLIFLEHERKENICEQSKTKEIMHVLPIDELQFNFFDPIEYWKECGDESVSSFAHEWRTTLSRNIVVQLFPIFFSKNIATITYVDPGPSCWDLLDFFLERKKT